MGQTEKDFEFYTGVGVGIEMSLTLLKRKKKVTEQEALEFMRELEEDLPEEIEERE